jgi:DNA gyrase/topoisomerase IV subunit A
MLSVNELKKLIDECKRIQNGYPENHNQYEAIMRHIEDIYRRFQDERKTNIIQRPNGSSNT